MGQVQRLNQEWEESEKVLEIAREVCLEMEAMASPKGKFLGSRGKALQI